MSDQVEKDAQEILREKNKAVMARVRAAKLQKRQAVQEQPVTVQEDEPEHEESETEEPPTKQPVQMAEKSPDDLDRARISPENHSDHPVSNNGAWSITSLLNAVGPVLIPTLVGGAAIYSGYQLYLNFSHMMNRVVMEGEEAFAKEHLKQDPFEGVQEPVPNPPQETKPEEVFRGNEFALPLLLSQ